MTRSDAQIATDLELFVYGFVLFESAQKFTQAQTRTVWEYINFARQHLELGDLQAADNSLQNATGEAWESLGYKT